MHTSTWQRRIVARYSNTTPVKSCVKLGKIYALGFNLSCECYFSRHQWHGITETCRAHFISRPCVKSCLVVTVICDRKPEVLLFFSMFQHGRRNIALIYRTSERACVRRGGGYINNSVESLGYSEKTLLDMTSSTQTEIEVLYVLWHISYSKPYFLHSASEMVGKFMVSAALGQWPPGLLWTVAHWLAH